MSNEYISEVSRSKDVRWYQKTLGDKLTPQCYDLLVNYSKIPERDVEEHIYEAVGLDYLSKSITSKPSKLTITLLNYK